MPSFMPPLKRLLRNASWSLSSRIATIISILVTTPIIINSFGLELMGVWLLANQVVTYLSLSGIGVPNALARYLAKYKAMGDSETATSCFSTAFVATTVSGLFVVGLTVLGSDHIGGFFDLERRLHSTASTVMLILGANVALMLPLQLGQGLLTSIHRFDRIAIWLTVSSLLRLFLVVLVFSLWDPGLPVLATIVVGTNLLGFALMFIDAWRMCPWISLNLHTASYRSLRSLVSLGIAALIITLAAMFTRQGNTVLVGRFLGPATVTLFAVPLMIVDYIVPLINLLRMQVYPVASEMAAVGEKENLLRFYRMATLYSFSLMAAMSLGAYFVGEDLLGLWLMHGAVTREQIELMAVNLMVLIGSYLFAVPGITGRAVLESVGLQHRAAGSELTSALLGLAISYSALRIFDMGIMAAVFGIAISFILRGGTLFAFTASYFSRPSPMLALQICGRPAAVLAASLLAGAVIDISLAPISQVLLPSWLPNCVALLVASSVWAVGTWGFVLEPSQREVVRRGLPPITIQK